MTLREIQPIAFFGALLVYAVFSSPTPDGFGWTEILIAGLLLTALRFLPSRENMYVLAAMVIGLCLPLLAGLVRGQEGADIIRDVIPFLFLFCPLFYGWIVEERPREVIAGVAVIGFIFSLRTIFVYRDILFFPAQWGMGPPADLLYLANSPEVLFSALLGIGYAGLYLAEDKFQITKSFFLLAASAAPLLAMALMSQRAGLGAVAAMTFVWLMVLLYFKPVKAVYIGAGLGLICLMALPFLGTILSTLWQKTELVGLNSRAQEWGAVIDVLSAKWSNLFFGLGWGGRLENPAVGGLAVNYTHSLFSSLLLKAGIVGTIITLLGVLFPVYRSMKVLCQNRINSRYFILLGVVLWPFLIPAMLYASYKSLGFGLILLVISIFSHRKLEKNQ